MDLNLNEQQEMLRKSARAFLAAECPLSLVRETQAGERGYPERLWTAMAELGWLGLAFPAKYGGEDGSFLDLVVLLEEMGRVALPGPFFPSIVLGGLTVLEAGGETQKRQILPGIIKGDVIATMALSEPDVPYDYSRVQMSAKKQGDAYILSGTKLFVPYAHMAGIIICVARDGEGNPGLFLVDPNSKGVTLTALRTTGEDKLFELRMNETAAAVLGDIRESTAALRHVLAKAAVAKSAEMLGCAGRVLELSTAYSLRREQFGRPIGTFQAIQHHCADMATDVDTMRLLTYEAAHRVTAGQPYFADASMAKAFANEACRRVVQTGHEIHGGVGVIIEHEMPLHYGQFRAAEVAQGNTYYHRELVARELGL